MSNAINLADIIKPGYNPKGKGFECLSAEENGGEPFIVNLYPHDPKEVEEIMEGIAEEFRKGRKRNVKRKEVAERIQKELNRHYIRGWICLTGKGLKHLMPIDLNSSEIDDDQEISHTSDNADLLIEHSEKLSKWVMEQVVRIDEFC